PSNGCCDTWPDPVEHPTALPGVPGARPADSGVRNDRLRRHTPLAAPRNAVGPPDLRYLPGGAARCRRQRLPAAARPRSCSRRLTRILIGSGLRIPLVDRPAARARRSGEHAAALGLAPVPRDLIVGLHGHVDPLPAEPGAFRLTRDAPGAPPRIEAHDPAGRRAAQEMLDRLDHLARANGGDGFIGQVMDAPPSSPGA